MLWAPVPETAIHEYSHSCPRKNEVGATNESPVPTPTNDLPGLQYFDKPQFSPLVSARADAGHKLRTGEATKFAHVRH